MPFLQEQDAAFVRTRFAQELRGDVTLEFFAPVTGGLTLPGQDGEIAEYARQILAEVAALSPKIRLNVHSIMTEPEAAKAFGIPRTPATAVIGAQDSGVRLYRMPAGYEFATPLGLLIAVSQGSTAVAPDPRHLLSHLSQDTHVQV